MVIRDERGDGRTKGMGALRRGAIAGILAFGLGAAAVPGCNRAEAPADETAQKDEAGQAAAERSLTLTIEATFPELPAGARVVAPSARDRQQLRVTRTDHTGLVGQVASVEESESLLFVSDPVAGGPATYGARIDLTLRPVASVQLADIAQDPWPEGEAPQVRPGAPELAPLAKPVNDGAATPAARALAALDIAKGWKVEAAGADDPLEVARSGAGTPFGIVAAYVELLTHAGVPARVVHGLLLDDGDSGSARPGVWAEVQLPHVGWVPVDPVAAREPGAPAQGTRALDRVPLLYGARVAVPGTSLQLQHALGGPIAVVGKGEAQRVIAPTTLAVKFGPPAPAE